MSVGVALLLAAVVSLPAVWWEPLHVDEAITLELAPGSASSIFGDVFVERGGSPIFFYVENVSLRWPGGVTGLRLPSVLFFLAAIALSAPVAERLRGRHAALLLPVLLAVAPLAVRLATFARMYTLLLAGVLLSVWLLLRTAERTGRAAWIGAGAVTGALVYVHPIAPLYIGIAFATVFLASGDPVRVFLRRARLGLATTVIVALPYVYALAVLSNKYGVGSFENSPFVAASARPVPHESLRSLASPGWALAAVLGTLAAAGLIAMLRDDRRIGAALALWVVVPVAFFSVVPSETSFYPRYLLPALPFFLLLVAEGCLAVGRFARRPALVAAALVGAIVVWEGTDSLKRDQRLADYGLTGTVEAVAETEDPVLFSSVGGPLGGRPALLVDAYTALELAGEVHVEELPAADPAHVPGIATAGAVQLRKFLAGPDRPGRGVWLFSGGPRRLDVAQRRLYQVPGLEVRRTSPFILVVHTRAALDRRTLVEQAVVVRQAWLGPNGHDRWSRLLIKLEREAAADAST